MRLRVSGSAEEGGSAWTTIGIYRGLNEQRHRAGLAGVPGCLVLSLRGYLDSYNVASFRTQGDKAIEAGFVRLVIDLSEVTYISNGIGVISYLLRQVKLHGGDVVVQGMHPSIRAVFQLLGFAQYFATTDTLGESIAYLRNRVTQAANS
jgi:anti-anti-sigma factor